MSKRDFLSIADLTLAEMQSLLDLAYRGNEVVLQQAPNRLHAQKSTDNLCTAIIPVEDPPTACRETS